MGALRAGEGRRLGVWSNLTHLFHLYLDLLMATEVHSSLSMLPAAPILPEHRGLYNTERMQQQTHPARLRRHLPVPLTLLAHLTAATVSNPGGEEHPQRTIRFAALLGRTQRLARRAAERAICLWSKVAPGEMPGFLGQARLGGSVANGESRTLSTPLQERGQTR